MAGSLHMPSLSFLAQRLAIALALCCAIMAVSSCDSVEPSKDNLMVVEGFLNADAPLPEISITKAISLAEGLTDDPVAINDASLRLFLDGQLIPYGPSATPGIYTPRQQSLTSVPSGTVFSAEIEWQSQRATIQDVVPPPIAIERVTIDVPSAPVAAILVDTLRLDDPQVGARKGFIYPIDVTIDWKTNAEAEDSDNAFWIETRLIPQSDFSSTVLDVFLLTEEVLQEDTLEPARASGDNNLRSWSGVYAVPVADSLAPPPSHNLRVQLIRGTKAYADFARSRNAPERREPVSNIEGAIGIVAGIAIDALEFEVQDGVATAQ